ncbi:hypothetical protein DICPUDRAFT_98853 [Dictyostelium purpureum]|uniref:Uncharacterized protein n=1 Tax=Dictyostelium purpureum TaxID=5786 RepID=F0ZU40_DICPU|nr:uncharacterized protein DICPUDRAFT_98853 [Dictyostelium purpureum]EGC32522.1 hypothetical protein DICPUDRAFT_98853 [Dictyostelium purpureum]|eukprot:XP_003290934.1 hypothetical protein DICPUDRAFT_98853 [Dictyostelium purpureum]
MSSTNGSPSFYIDGYIRDLMSIKASTKSSIKAQSLLTSSPFGGLNQSEVKPNKDVFKCPDDSKNWTRINIVKESKKKIEKKDQTIFTFRRRKPALFQYKYYKDQEPLKITEQEIVQVVRVIINPATPQDRSIATKIFIKIILDIYCKDGLVVQSSEKLISSYFHQFISSTNRDTRAHTFNILFNLSIHINLYSELKLEDGGNIQTTNSSGGLSMIRDLQESVFRILVEMVQHLIDFKERDERTWQEALNCILFFITEEGYVIKEKLFQLNSQMIASFLLYIQDLNDNVKRILVRMLTNFLYKDPICNQINYQNNYLNLNEEEVNNVGGINFILQLYTTVRSSESKNNLFVIIFDYVLLTALKTQTIEQSQIINESPLLLELFRKSDASHYFTQIFKCIPEHGFISKFFLYTSEEAKHDSSYSYEDLIIKFTMKLEEFATRYQSIDSNYEKLILDCQEVPERLNQLINDTLNNEDDEVSLFYAENWLFLLLKKSLIDKESNPQFNFSINTYIQLASNLSSRLRRMYISLTERLLLLSKFRLSTSETKTIEIFDMFNDRFTKLISQGEKSENNLMYIVDILFDMIYKRAGTGLLRSKESVPDTNYSLFLSNQFVVSISLLKLFNINIIQYLFNNLQHSENTKEQRLFLLHILIQRCNDEEDLKKVGGISFFKNLLSDLSTQIAYHASYFLLTQLEAESPEEYRSILTRLLSKARENNDENLISNPFFQVQGIIEMTHKALNNSNNSIQNHHHSHSHSNQQSQQHT